MKELALNMNILVIALIIMVIAIVIMSFAIPKLIGIIKFINVLEGPNERSSHVNFTPNLGGVIFYLCLVIFIFFISIFDENLISLNILTGLSILFFVGIKDDIMVVSPKVKLIAQIVAISFIVFSSEFYLYNYHELFDLRIFPKLIFVFFSYLILVSIINAYNLIDGIDGLASLLGTVIVFIYSIFFYFLNLNYYFLLSVVIMGILIGFLRFNLSKDNKIFMGDTGSMIIGFIIGVLTLRFLTLSEFQLESINISSGNKFPLVLSILFFPIIDVIRVVVIRLSRNKYFFVADRSHLHHMFIDKGLTHKKTSILLTFVSLFIFLFTYFLNLYLSPVFLFIALLVLVLFHFYALWLLDLTPIANRRRKIVKAFLPKKLYYLEFKIRKYIIILLKKKILK